MWRSGRGRSACIALALALGGAPALGQEIRVRLEGAAPRDGQATMLSEAAGQIRVNPGTVDSLGFRQPSSGRHVRWHNGKGAFIVWTLRATVWHPGPTARFELQQEPGVSETNRLRFALGNRAPWTSPTSGRELAHAGRTMVHPAVTNGESLVFELALPIHDTDPAGPLSSSVRYFVELNQRRFLVPAP